MKLQVVMETHIQQPLTHRDRRHYFERRQGELVIICSDMKLLIDASINTLTLQVYHSQCSQLY